jgi:hypothetical protein
MALLCYGLVKINYEKCLILGVYVRMHAVLVPNPKQMFWVSSIVVKLVDNVYECVFGTLKMLWDFQRFTLKRFKC